VWSVFVWKLWDGSRVDSRKTRCFWRVFTLWQLWQKLTPTLSHGSWYLTHRDMFLTHTKKRVEIRFVSLRISAFEPGCFLASPVLYLHLCAFLLELAHKRGDDMTWARASARTRAETVVTDRDETDLNWWGSARARGSCGLLWQSTVFTSFIKKKGYIYFWKRTQATERALSTSAWNRKATGWSEDCFYYCS